MALFQLIAHPPESRQFFLMGSGDCRWISQAPMHALRRSGKHRALLGRTVANGDNRRKSLPSKFRNGFRALRRDIDPRLRIATIASGFTPTGFVPAPTTSYRAPPR